MVFADPLDPPDLGRTIHAIGDLHFGSINTNRATKAANDVVLKKPATPIPAARIMLGDLVNNGLTSEDALVLAWIASLGTAAPIYRVLGNHDIFNDVRTPTQAATALGLPGNVQNFTVDLGFALLVGFFPGDGFTAYSSGSQASAANLTWLDNTLAAATKDVIVCCHFNIYNTVAGNPATQFVSTQAGFYIATTSATADSSGVLAVLASHAGKVKVWLAAHTHSNIDTAGMISTVTVGGQKMVCVNASAIVSTDQAGGIHTALNSAFLTYWGTDTASPRIELRWKSHGQGTWTAPTDSTRVQRAALV